jgi:hypothetical protein
MACVGSVTILKSTIDRINPAKGKRVNPVKGLLA